MEVWQVVGLLVCGKRFRAIWKVKSVVSFFPMKRIYQKILLLRYTRTGDDLLLKPCLFQPCVFLLLEGILREVHVYLLGVRSIGMGKRQVVHCPGEVLIYTWHKGDDC